jgi:HPt (histidine-containing phosphotransfer) domain-containing protein
MAINYNLSKVYALSDNDSDFVLEIVRIFVVEIPVDLKKMECGIKEKDYNQAFAFAHKIKPSLELLGMLIAHEEIIQVERWSEAKGKRKQIEATYESIKRQIEKAIKEIKKDFSL